MLHADVTFHKLQPQSKFDNYWQRRPLYWLWDCGCKHLGIYIKQLT